MIINNDEASKRLNSPLNLINKLRDSPRMDKAKDAMSIFIKPARPPLPEEIKKIDGIPFELLPYTAVKTNQSEPAETLDQILENHESQISLGLAHDSALKLLNNSITHLAAKLEDVRADRLPAAILAASKVVESIRKERNEVMKSNKDKEVHYHFYTPEQRKIADYEVIEVS